MIDEYTGLELSESSAKEAPVEKKAPKKSDEKKEEKPAAKPADKKEGLVQMQPGEYNQMYQQMTHNPFAPPQQPQMANEMYEQSEMEMGGMTMMESAGSGMYGGESGSLSYAAF